MEYVVKFGIAAPNLDGLYQAASEGKDDQRVMDPGHEYHENDGGEMDGAIDVETETGEIKGLPSPDQIKPTYKELEKACDDGYAAAEAGKPQSDCPIISSESVIEWVKEWKAWHEDHPNEDKKVA